MGSLVLEPEAGVAGSTALNFLQFAMVGVFLLTLLASVMLNVVLAPSRFIPLYGYRWTKLNALWVGLVLSVAFATLSVAVTADRARLIARFVCVKVAPLSR